MVSYWPELNEVLKAGRLKIRCISFEKQETFDIRHLEISHSGVGNLFSKHFCFLFPACFFLASISQILFPFICKSSDYII